MAHQAKGLANSENDMANLDVMLIINGKKKADTWINISAKGNLIEVPGAAVLSALTELISKGAINRLGEQMGAKGMLSNKVLARFGILVSYNAKVGQLTLSILTNKDKPSSSPAKDSGSNTSGNSPKSGESSGPWTTPLAPAKIQEPDSVLEDFATPETLGTTPDLGNATGLTTPAPASVRISSYQLDRTRDELFEDVFKRKPLPLPAIIEVTLFVDGKPNGTILLNYSEATKNYTFPVDPISEATHGIVKPEIWEKINRLGSSGKQISVESLVALGLPTTLNLSLFELSIAIPAEFIGLRIHQLSGAVTDPYGIPSLKPNFISGYLNARIKQRISYSQFNPTPYDTAKRGIAQVEARNRQNRQAVTASFDGAINLMSWVIEGSATATEKIDTLSVSLKRQDIRLVRDWPKQALRFSAGDLIFPTSGYQSFKKMGGIGLSRDFSLQPHLPAYPVKEFEFFLANPAEVKIYINGSLRGTYQLTQGAHDLKGFPFTTGESDVQIEIVDNTGEIQKLSFSFIHEPSLLAKGKSAFSYNIGLASNQINYSDIRKPQQEKKEIWNYEYDISQPALFLDYKRGMTDRLTTEIYVQTFDTAGTLGLEALRAIKIGRLKAGFATSFEQTDGFDYAGNLEYTFIPKLTSNISPISWRIKGEYLGDKFFRNGQDQSYLGSYTLAASILKNSYFGNFSFGTAYSLRPDSVDFYDLNLGLSKGWANGWSGSLTLKNSFTTQRSTNTWVAANCNYFFGRDEHTLSASGRVENHRPEPTEPLPPPDWDYYTDMKWDYNQSGPFPTNPSLGLETNFGPFFNNYNGIAGWKGNQGYLQVLGRRYEPKTTSIITNYVDLSLHSSLVFVNGTFAIARPITNSFLLVKGVDNEALCDIYVNQNDLGYDAKSSNWLPGVVSNISPYSLKKVNIVVQDAPFGASDEKTEFTLFPTYKRGYRILMGSNATIIALGTLQLSPGVPAEYQTFTAKRVEDDEADEEPIQGFTNGVGKFQLMRLRPGRYLIEMSVAGKKYVTAMTLPRKSYGLKNIGTLVLGLNTRPAN
jgi:outer membrane usher protein